MVGLNGDHDRYFAASHHRLVEKLNAQARANLFQPEIEKLKAAVRAKITATGRAKGLNNTFKRTKRSSPRTRGRRSDCDIVLNHRSEMLPDERSAYFLFEFASGYALFYAHRVEQLIDKFNNFESHDKYINLPDSFTLKAFLPFSSISNALIQMNSIFNSMVTPQLKSFLLDNLPKRIDGESTCYLAVSDPVLGDNILMATRTFGIKGGLWCYNLMRGLRMKIHKFIDGLEPKDLEKQQLNLARLYSRQRCTTMVGKCSKPISSSSLQQLVFGPHRGRQACTTMVVKSSKPISSSSLQQFVVVPHRFDGVFIAKGKEDFICTRNLVPGEALYGEELIYAQNEDGTEIEYRVWNPLRSKLAAAILCGVNNMWVKPGSRVLYLGDVCEITVAHLSDLVGMDGLVYVVGWSDVVVNMAEKWSNVIMVFEKPYFFWKYRMVVGMVDVIFADIVYPQEVDWIATNAGSYLRAGGHYMISTPMTNINSTSQGKDLFANHHRRREFNPIEIVMLESIVREYAMAVGGFRVSVC